MASPAVDGTAFVKFTNASTGSASLTTTGTGRAVYAVVVWGGNFTQGATTYGATSVASISSPNTTSWKKVASGNANGTGVPTSPSTGATCYVEVWQGLAAAALTAESITVTMSGSVNNNVDSGLMAVRGVSSAVAYSGPSNDTNASIPAVAVSYDSHAVAPGPNAFETATISTNSPADLLISLGCNINNAVGQGIPAGFTTLVTQSNSAGNFWATLTSGYEQVSVAQTNAAITASNTIGTTEGWVFIVLAISNGPGNLPAPPPTFSLMSNTNVH